MEKFGGAIAVAAASGRVPVPSSFGVAPPLALLPLLQTVIASPYCFGTVDHLVKNNMPGKLFFVFAKE